MKGYDDWKLEGPPEEEEEKEERDPDIEMEERAERRRIAAEILKGLEAGHANLTESFSKLLETGLKLA